VSTALAISALLVFGISGPASAGTVKPLSCQGPSANLVLETSARGYNYNCSGWQNTAYPSGTYAYYVSPGGWSGVVRTVNGDYGFCDFKPRSIPNYRLLNIYLSPTKEPWC
jgi:hypothetical protein